MLIASAILMVLGYREPNPQLAALAGFGAGMMLVAAFYPEADCCGEDD